MAAAYPPPAAERIPATMLAAPNRIKHPIMTTAPWRQLMRPVNIMNPTAATAITATTVATVPSSVPCSQLTASIMTPDPAGSAGIPANAGADTAIRLAIRQALKNFDRFKLPTPFSLKDCVNVPQLGDVRHRFFDGICPSRLSRPDLRRQPVIQAN